jgi:hypothetical protein
VGVPNVAEATIGGGLSADVSMTLSNPNNLEKERPFLGDLGSDLFEIGGQITAGASAGIKVGVTVLGNFIGYQHEWDFGTKTLFSFGGATSVPIPPELTKATVPPVALATYDPASKSLIINAGSFADQRNYSPDTIDENFTVEQSGFDLNHFLFKPTYTVTAFGISQTYGGNAEPIDTILADMGDGDDTLTFEDITQPLVYAQGGDGNDRITMQNCACDTSLIGGNGDDTLEGGDGKNALYLDGGIGDAMSAPRQLCKSMAAWTRMRGSPLMTRQKPPTRTFSSACRGSAMSSIASPYSATTDRSAARFTIAN